MGPALARLLLDLPGAVRGPTRRELLALVAGGPPLLLLGCRPRTLSRGTVDGGIPPDRAAGPTSPGPSPRPYAGHVLTADEWRTYELALARILPSGEGAGARETNVIGFVDAQLGTRLVAPALPLFRTGARLLDGWARRRHGRGFADLDEPAADAILDELSRGTIPASGIPQAALFAALVELALEGFLGDPIHGGNEEQRGWRAVGFAEPHRRTPGPVEAGAHHHPPPSAPDGGTR